VKPLEDVRAWPPIAVYDIEAENWVDVTLVGHVDELGNRRTFKSVSLYLQWLFSPAFKSDHVWAHWGGHYDHRFIIHYATIRGWNWETIQSGNSIIIVTIKHSNGKEIRFCESARLMPDSVAKIGKTVGLAKLDVDRSRIQDLTEEQLDEYCLRDCDIVLLGMQYLKKALTEVGADFAYTLASIASRWVRRSPVLEWRKFYEGNDFNQGYSSQMLLADEFCTPAYFGGRVEVFKRGLFKQKLYYYDIRSSYPWSMLQDLPTYFSGFGTPFKSIDASLAKMGISDCTVTVPESVHIPVLAMKRFNKLLFPTGTFRGRWTNIELQKALAQGAKIEIHAQANFQHAPFLRPFVETFYKLRQKSIDDGDSFRSYAYKILLNSLYGKLIESIERTKSIFGKQNVGRAMHLYSTDKINRDGKSGYIKPTHIPGVYSIITESDGPFRHVAAGAYVTAMSRLRLLEGMELTQSLGGQVFYCDTDSIVTDVDMGNHPLMQDSLGSFKLERTIIEGEFVSPKVYRMIDEKTNEQIFKVKGTPVKGKDDTDSLNRWKDYISGVAIGKEGITGFATDMRNGSIMPKAMTLMRALKKHDTKRLHDEGMSTPLHIEDSP